jgi:hypothetical protein
MMCPRFYQLRHVQRLDRGTKALRIGSMTHKLLEAYSSAKTDGIEHTPEPPEDALPEEYEIAEKLYYAYKRTYKDEKIVVIQPEVEVSVRFGAITSPEACWEIYLISKLDGIVSLDERKYLMEYKTCANLGAAQFAKFHNDFQVSTYLWMAVKALQMPLDGAIITLLPKTKYPEPARLIVTRNAHQFREWEQTVLHEARSLISYMEHDYFPQRQINCTKWNRACIFHDYCMTGEDTNLVDLERRDFDYADQLRRQLMKGEPNEQDT